MFTFRSLTTALVYDGVYNFTFSALDCPADTQDLTQCTKSPDFIYSFKVILKVEDDTDLYAALKFDVEIYDDDRFQIHHVDVSTDVQRETERKTDDRFSPSIPETSHVSRTFWTTTSQTVKSTPSPS
jgi:hypothetical protein